MLSKALQEYLPINLDAMRQPGFLKKRSREIKQCVKNVASGKGWQEIIRCPLCNGDEREVVFSRFGIDIVQCGSCGCGYAEKFPRDTADVYSSEEYLPIAQSDYLDNVTYRFERFGKERLSLIDAYLDKVPADTRLLDVGCGTGWFLEMAQKQGYKVFGQELGKELAAFTATRLGITVWDRAFTAIDPNEHFDAITLFDVIEHVPNPREVLQSVCSHLNPEGIALMFTPNLDSFAFRTLKEKSSLVMPVEHLYYFTEKSLRRIIEEAGLDVIYFATRGMDIPDIYSYYRDETDQEQVAGFLRQHCDELQAMIDAAQSANHMRFIVKRRT